MVDSWFFSFFGKVQIIVLVQDIVF